MALFGPVANAAHGAHSSGLFDLLVGLSVLALTWIGYARTNTLRRATIWAALGVSIICGVFIVSGFIELSR